MRTLLMIISLVLICGAITPDVLADEISLTIVDPNGSNLTRDQLYHDFRVLEDLGEFLVVDPQDTDWGLFEKWSLPHETITVSLEGRDLYAVSLMNSTAEELSRRITPLHCGQLLALAVLSGTEAKSIERRVPHYGMKNGLMKLELQPIPPMTEFVPPASWNPESRVADPKIQAMVDLVDAASIQSVVQDMEDMGERRAGSGDAIAETYLVNKFNSIGGLTVTTHHFSSSYADNVIAELPGTIDPSIIYVVGGHYDSTSWSGPAPGADDNASGTAGVYEIARVLSQFQFKHTIRFCAFGAEEVGLVGSDAYCDYLVAQGDNVQAMINLDMMAYRASGDAEDVDFISNYSSQSLIDFCKDMYADYVPTLGVVQGSFSGGTSDHQSFTNHGFAACFPFEDIDSYSPHIHSSNDLIGPSANNFTLARKITQGVLASIATLAAPVDLEIQHTMLGDTTNASGPYTVEADVTSLISSNVTQVTLNYDIGSGMVAKNMVPKGGDGYISSIPGKATGGYVDYYLEAFDDQGNSERLPSGIGGDHFSFFVGHHVDVFADDFETSGPNWTYNNGGEWQRNQPLGAGSYDPDHAASGAYVYGNDLGQFGSDGDYEASINTYLQSPSIDCTGKTGVTLRYKRWLTVEEGKYDEAKILVNNNQVYINPYNGDLIDSEWVLHEIDISAHADNNPNVQIRFTLESDTYVERGGWTIDDLHVGTIEDGDIASLSHSEVYLSTATGGTIDFDLEGTSTLADRKYIMLVSGTGTSPGTPVGSVVLPLNWDILTDICFTNLNSIVFSNFLNSLDGNGQAAATLNLPVITDPSAIGVNLSFAWATLKPIDFASDAVNVLLVP